MDVQLVVLCALEFEVVCYEDGVSVSIRFPLLFDRDSSPQTRQRVGNMQERANHNMALINATTKVQDR